MANWRDKNTAKHRVLFASGTATSRTRSGAPNEVDTVDLTIPANTLEAGDVLRIDVLYSCTDNANVKRGRVKLGGSYIVDWNLASQADARKSISIFFEDTTTAKLFYKSTNVDNGVDSNALSSETTGIDTTADMTLAFATSINTDGDTMAVEGYVVEVIKGD